VTTTAPTRVIGARRALPSGRAVTGGFLVAVAATGSFVSYRGAASGPSHRYVVAAHDVAAGATLGAGDLEVVLVDLPDAQAGHAFADTAAVSGRVALSALHEGELVQSSAVADRDKSDPRFEVSLPIERARALGGSIEPGERVDVVATVGDGRDARTEVVALRAQVVRVIDAKRSSVGTSGDVVVALALPTEDEVLAVTHASRAGSVTIVRATGVVAAGGPAAADKTAANSAKGH
jgi:Flp pilus assembly protein CpaB